MVVVAGSQIRQIGKDQEPLDGSNSENEELFMKDMGVWMDGMSKDQNMERFGYVDTNNIPVTPYGTAAAS